MMIALAIVVLAWLFVALGVVVLCVAAHRGDLNERPRAPKRLPRRRAPAPWNSLRA